MASTGSRNHFDALLLKRTLRPGLSFKCVDAIEVDFGDNNGIQTDNFIDKIMEFKEMAKKNAGFMLLRPKQGVEIFTKGVARIIDTNNNHNKSDKMESDHMDDDDDDDGDLSHIDDEIKFDVMLDAIPKLNECKEEYVDYEIQKASNWKVPIFHWNGDHKKAIVKQNRFKKEKSKLAKVKVSVFHRENDDDNKMNIDDVNGTNGANAAGVKRKNDDDIDSRPRKRQKIEDRAPSPLSSYNHGIHSDSTTTTNVSMLTESAGFTIGNNEDDNVRYFNNKDLEFYRGFGCLTYKQSKMKQKKLNQYMDALTMRMKEINQRIPYNNRQKMEDKYLTFLKYLYDGNSTYQGHIKDSKKVSPYHNNSPFKPQDLVKYGPFSCLKEEEYVSGVTSPILYINQCHTYCSWHVGMFC